MAYNTILDRSMFTIFFFSTMLLLLTLVFKIVIDCLHNEYCLCNVLSQSAAVTSQQGRQSEDDVRLCLLPIYSNRYVMHIIVVCGKITVALSRRNAAVLYKKLMSQVCHCNYRSPSSGHLQILP